MSNLYQAISKTEKEEAGEKATSLAVTHSKNVVSKIAVEKDTKLSISEGTSQSLAQGPMSDSPPKMETRSASKDNSKIELAPGTSPAPSALNNDGTATQSELTEDLLTPDNEETADSSMTGIHAVLAPEAQLMAGERQMLDGAVVASDVHVVKKKWLPNKKASLIIGCVVLIAIAVGIALGLTLGDDSDGGDSVPSSIPSMAPTLAPTMGPSATPSVVPTTDGFSMVAALVESIFGNKTLEDSNSPQYRAALWMAEVDELIDYSGIVSADRFAQRFAVVVLYYATGGDTTWERQANFLSPTTHECDWNATAPSNLPAATGLDGVALCSVDDASQTRRVVFIDFFANGMSGTLPNELGALSGLLGLFLNVNSIQGTLPKSLFRPDLLALQLPFNNLTGTIPTEIGQATALIQLWIERSSMTGTIPTEIGRTAMQAMILATNSFNGTIPSTLPQLTDLEILGLYANRFEGEFALRPGVLPNLRNLALQDNEHLNGTLPEDIGSRPLEIYSIAGNSFSGTIPESIQQSTSLTQLLIGRNVLTGTIPSDWNNMSQSLLTLTLESNLLTGTLPESLGNVTNLEFLAAGGNSLNGTLPARLGDSMAALLLQENQLTGTVPESYGQLEKLRSFTLFWNMLTGNISFFCNGNETLRPTLQTLHADCLGEVICPCCQLCCDSDDECAFN